MLRGKDSKPPQKTTAGSTPACRRREHFPIDLKGPKISFSSWRYVILLLVVCSKKIGSPNFDSDFGSAIWKKLSTWRGLEVGGWSLKAFSKKHTALNGAIFVRQKTPRFQSPTGTEKNSAFFPRKWQKRMAILCCPLSSDHQKIWKVAFESWDPFHQITSALQKEQQKKGQTQWITPISLLETQKFSKRRGFPA